MSELKLVNSLQDNIAMRQLNFPQGVTSANKYDRTKVTKQTSKERKLL